MGLLAGCAAGGASGGGGESLPNRGFAPWEVQTVPSLDPEDPPRPRALFESESLTFGGPSALVTSAGVALYAHACPAEGACAIVRAHSADGLSFDAPAEVLAGAASYTDPFVERDGNAWTLWVVVDGAAIGRSLSADGRNFEPPEVVLTDDAPGSPSVADGVLYFARGEPAEVVRRPLPEGPTAVVFAPTPDCDGAPCWDADGRADPEVRLSRSGTGRRLLRMAYAGRKGSASQVGFAASRDGARWSPFAFNPALEDDGSVSAPSSVMFEGRYLMYAVRGRRTPILVVAVDAEGAPADVF